MVIVTLQSSEGCEAEFACRDTVAALLVSATGGSVEVSLQATRDGFTWGSPVASVRVRSESKLLRFELPERTRAIRAILQNNSRKLATVRLGEEPVAQKTKI